VCMALCNALNLSWQHVRLVDLCPQMLLLKTECKTGIDMGLAVPLESQVLLHVGLIQGRVLGILLQVVVLARVVLLVLDMDATLQCRQQVTWEGEVVLILVDMAHQVLVIGHHQTHVIQVHHLDTGQEHILHHVAIHLRLGVVVPVAILCHRKEQTNLAKAPREMTQLRIVVVQQPIQWQKMILAALMRPTELHPTPRIPRKENFLVMAHRLHMPSMEGAHHLATLCRAQVHLQAVEAILMVLIQDIQWQVLTRLDLQGILEDMDRHHISAVVGVTIPLQGTEVWELHLQVHLVDTLGIPMAVHLGGVALQAIIQLQTTDMDHQPVILVLNLCMTHMEGLLHRDHRSRTATAHVHGPACDQGPAQGRNHGLTDDAEGDRAAAVAPAAISSALVPLLLSRFLLLKPPERFQNSIFVSVSCVP